MAPQGKAESGDFAGTATGRTRDYPATILICWLIAAIVVVLALVLSGAAAKTAGLANPFRQADAPPIDRPARLPA